LQRHLELLYLLEFSSEPRPAKKVGHRTFTLYIDNQKPEIHFEKLKVMLHFAKKVSEGMAY